MSFRRNFKFFFLLSVSSLLTCTPAALANPCFTFPDGTQRCAPEATIAKFGNEILVFGGVVNYGRTCGETQCSQSSRALDGAAVFSLNGTLIREVDANAVEGRFESEVVVHEALDAAWIYGGLRSVTWSGPVGGRSHSSVTLADGMLIYDRNSNRISKFELKIPPEIDEDFIGGPGSRPCGPNGKRYREHFAPKIDDDKVLFCWRDYWNNANCTTKDEENFCRSYDTVNAAWEPDPSLNRRPLLSVGTYRVTSGRATCVKPEVVEWIGDSFRVKFVGTNGIVYNDQFNCAGSKTPVWCATSNNQWSVNILSSTSFKDDFCTWSLNASQP